MRMHTRFKNFLFRIRAAFILKTSRLRRQYATNVCGHRTRLTDVIRRNGEFVIWSTPLEENGKPDYCIDCLAAMSIPCAWCGEPIDVGEPITLYHPSEFDRVRSDALEYLPEPGSVIGCLSTRCSDSSADRAGFWMPPGVVERIPTPVELSLMSGDAIVVTDVSDSDEAKRLIAEVTKTA